MSSLHISILFTLLTIIIADNNKTFYFTKSNYELWCQENILSNSLFLYPNRIPIGILRTSNIKSVTYHLLDDTNNGLFQIKTKRLADFYFLIINITRPFDINREYQDVYTLHIEAQIITTQENQTEQTEIRLYVADSNDNDGVFDMDVYEQNYTQPIDTEQSLIQFHASDADEIQHAQIFYELGSLLNETFSLHPYTGELYLLTKENLKSSYEFDIFAYDRHRKRLVDNNMKTKTHVKLNFHQLTNTINKYETFETIFNQTFDYHKVVSSYEINIIERKSVNLLNIHQPILTLGIKPNEKSFELFLLNNSSLNTKNLFVSKNNIYLNKYLIEEYNLQLFICFNNRTQCQYTKYRYIPFIDFNFYQFRFKSIEKIYIDENLPVDSFIKHIQIDSSQYSQQQQSLLVNYKLLNDDKNYQFYINPKTGILRLAERLEYRIYTLDIQANINLFNRRYSTETTIEIHVREINKYRPVFRNNTPTDLFQLPYQFEAYDYDQNKETNGRITYRLWNCFDVCPFQIDPNNGTLSLINKDNFDRNSIYDLQIIAFDWGQPISFQNSIDIRIDLVSKINKRSLQRTRAYSRRWRKNSTAMYFTTTTTTTMFTEKSTYDTTVPSNIDTVYLNIGFHQNLTTYYISEDTEINTIIDRLKIDYDAFPLDIDDENDNIFFYTMNDTSVPFVIDQNEKFLKLINKIDRENQYKYVFEIELKLKSIYSMKLQEQYNCQKKNSRINFQYSNKFYQKMLVTIYINDINDNIPQCVHFHTNIDLNENEIKKNLYQIQAFDPDLGENGTITYSLLDYTDYFSIDPLTGQIDCIKSIDYEEYSFIELHTIVLDQGLQIQFQSICTTLHITINDINDNTPQFSSNDYFFNLFSDMPRYSTFGQISAIDIDKNNELTYSINPNPYVTINTYTGHLRLKYSLHRLIDQILNVTVQVSDGLHQNQTIIFISVKSFPDPQQPILLSEPAYGLTINESLSIDSIITNAYRRFQILSSTIDFIEIIHDEIKSPFSIDQQGYIRLTHSLIGLSQSSYWLPIRLTRYHAHPPHAYIHMHITIRQENFYLPQCVDTYQNVKAYDYSTDYPFARIEATSLNKNSLIQYSIVDSDKDEKLFSIDKQKGSLQLLPAIQNNRRSKSDYFLTINALDNQHKLSVNCYLKIQLIRRNQLVPKFISSPVYNIDLPEIQYHSGRLRQRLFQIVALLDHQVYDRKLEVRYRIVDSNQHFIINRQTGYIAAKQPLNPYTIYEFHVQAFTVAHQEDILSDGNGNENDDDEHSQQGKWRVVSARKLLPIKLRILPTISLDKSLLSPIDSTINIDLLKTTDVGSTILHLGINNRFNNTQWFIMIGYIRHTRYFHVDFQTGHLMLIRPIDELVQETDTIELRINITSDWINMNTIKVIVRIMNNKIPSVKFSQTDYYSSISKSIPMGAEIARLTIENSAADCTYSIDSVERIKSYDLFRINAYSGSITVSNSLVNSQSQAHLLKIVYRCQHNYHIAHTNLHINILDEKNPFNQTQKSFRFSQDNYLIIFETSLMKNRPKHLVDFELISNNDDGIRRKPDAKIIRGDPFGLFTIDSLKQSLILVDESLSRSYIYPINLTIIDTSQDEFINTTVTIFISNIGIHFPCPTYLKSSPYIFTYESIESRSIDLSSHNEYKSLIIRAFDPFTPINGEASNQAECIINSEIEYSNDLTIKNLDFIFENEIYLGYINDTYGLSSFVYNPNQEPIELKIKNSFPRINSFDITYYLLNQTNKNFLQLDEYAGLIKYNLLNQILNKKYSLIVYAKYETLITFTRLNLFTNEKDIFYEKSSFQSIYEFKLYTPFVNNYTIGFLNKKSQNFLILNENILPLISIDKTGRLFVKNRTFLLTNGNFYDFLVQDENLEIIRIQILILTQREQINECILNRLEYSNDNKLVGFIEILNSNQTEMMCYQTINRSYYLLNYNDLFLLDRQHGLLYYRNQTQINHEDLLILIQIDNSKCLITIDKVSMQTSYVMIRNGSQLYFEISEQYRIEKPSGQIKLQNNTLLNYDIVPSYSPVFSNTFYEFSLNLSNTNNERIFISQLLAQPYDTNHSHIVYRLVNRNKYYHMNPDNGIIEYIPSRNYNKTIEQFQIVAYDLIYNQNTTINITIHINRKDTRPIIYYKTISEILPPGSLLFQTNISSHENLEYTLKDYNSDFFEINSTNGDVFLRNYLIDKFYAFKIHVLPIDQILIVKLSITNYNQYKPNFYNLPSNLSFSLTNKFLTKFSANDYDSENLQYYILNKDQEKIFSLNQTTGILLLNSTEFNQTTIQLSIGVTDGLHLTKAHLQLNFFNYTKHLPKFSSNEYIFYYEPTQDTIGQIAAYDLDLNDEIYYEIYLQPNEISISKYSGVITIQKSFSFTKSFIEFYASARDLANQIVYTKVKIFYTTEPKFRSYLYYISLNSSNVKLPMNIFQMEIVDLFNQPLNLVKYQLKNPTNFFEINENKLMLKEYLNNNYRLTINAYWKNFIIQTSIEVQIVENLIKLNKNYYEFSLDKSFLNENFLIETFPINNLTLKIVSTPLTRFNCIENFYIRQNQIFFKNYPIVSDLCFFELQLTDNVSIHSSQVKVSFIDNFLKPKFSSSIYSFHANNRENLFRVFASNANKVQYQLQNNSYGLMINQTYGSLTFKYGLDFIKDMNQIELDVYAYDEKTLLNDTAVIKISLNDEQKFVAPNDYSQISLCPNEPVLVSDQSLPGTVIQDITIGNNNISPYNYYILSGDTHGLFSVSNLGQLYLTSPMLNKTSEEFFELTILISSSSSSLSYCRTNVSIIRTPKWSYFICPSVTIEWTVEEESPIGTIVGTVKEILLSINNSSELIDKIHMKFNNTYNDAQAFLLNSQTGMITSNSRLDYEQKTSYSLSIVLEPDEFNCSIPILIELINKNDNPILFDVNSLVYNITENNILPYYIGRINLIDIDQLYSYDYEYYLKNPTKQISIDPITGSIILNEQLDREYHGFELQFDIIAMDNKEDNLTSKLIFYINDLNDHGPKFDQEYHSINISKSLRPDTIIFQVNATSEDPIVNGLLTYELINASDYFYINQHTGIIRLKTYLSSIIMNYTLTVKVFEADINLTDYTNIFISIVNDDNMYFNLNEKNNCFLEENKIINSEVCTIGFDSNDFIYELIDPVKYFQIIGSNGTIINKKVFDYETDQHEYTVTIIAKDRENQSIILSSLNFTIQIQNINDNYPEFITKNFTTIVYLFHPSINTVVHIIEAMDKDQSNLTFELLNDTYSSYKLQTSINQTELSLIEPILIDRDDNFIIRLWDNITNLSSYYIDLHIRLIYIQRSIDIATVIPQEIDAYINIEENYSTLNFGPLFIQNQSEYKFIYYNIIKEEHFFLKQISNTQVELHFNSLQEYSQEQNHRLLHYQIDLTAIALNQPIPEIKFSNNTIIHLPKHMNSQLKSHFIDINLWPIDREMLERSLSVIINLNSQSTYEQFIINSLRPIREYLAEVIGVNINHVHIYTFDLKAQHQIELLIAIIRYPSRLRPPRYIHKKLLYNALKNSTHLFVKIIHIKSIEKILINQCDLKSCENNGRCTSQIKLLNNQYEYFYHERYQRLLPKYQWNVKCLCLNHYYGQRCQHKQHYESPCTSNPCSPLERCIEESATLYTCQCIDEPCNYNEVPLENTLDCININSPTCRDSSNTLTFDGYSFVRMNSTMNFTQHVNLTFTFRTQVGQGKLIKLIAYDTRKQQHLLIIQIKDGHINFQLNKKTLFQFNEILINDSLWHHIYFSIDYALNNNYYYHVRLDHVFSHKIHLTQHILINQLKEFFIGNDFHGCLGNLTINNQTIHLQKQENNNFIEHIGTNNGCQLAEMETRTLRHYNVKDDLCSVHHPCYHGGICSNHNTKHGLSFVCNCLKPRFAGRQCQFDLQPCLSQPCLFNEQCVSANQSYSCISSLMDLPISTKNSLYLGLAFICCTFILIVLLFISLIIYCQQRRKDRKRRDTLNTDKPLVSAPLLTQKSSPTANTIENPMQTLLKLNHNGKQTVEAMPLGDQNHVQSTLNNFNDKAMINPLSKSPPTVDESEYQGHESLNRRHSDPKHYSTIGRMNIPPDNFLAHYNSIDYESPHTPLVNSRATDLFDFPSSSTKYFNGHKDENIANYQIGIKTLSNLTEKLAEQNDMEITHSSNDSSNNEQTLLTSPISHSERKRSLFNGGSTHSILASNSSLQKAPVYAKIIKTPSKPPNSSGMSTIERLRLSGSPLRLLSSSPTYARTTSFLKSNLNHDNNQMSQSSSSSIKHSKINPTSWKINPRKLDSLKARRNSRHTDDDDDDNHVNNTETSQLTTTATTINRYRHASDSDLTKEHTNGKKATKLSSFFQTEV
ncbi:unnamed protein product [Rotaria socialis]|uniref:Uncharacterized protein n=1 Tax=Rotaria socialis TaxID=392032 RepID=A0A820B2Y4_9BILA|nr:unnamed protein product [Rotaria socialis]CAF4192629.1 unnamed protein product [Rotaria socialis]